MEVHSRRSRSDIEALVEALVDDHDYRHPLAVHVIDPRAGLGSPRRSGGTSASIRSQGGNGGSGSGRSRLGRARAARSQYRRYRRAATGRRWPGPRRRPSASSSRRGRSRGFHAAGARAWRPRPGASASTSAASCSRSRLGSGTGGRQAAEDQGRIGGEGLRGGRAGSRSRSAPGPRCQPSGSAPSRVEAMGGQGVPVRAAHSEASSVVRRLSRSRRRTRGSAAAARGGGTAGVEQVVADGRLAAAEDLGHLGGGQALDLAQQEDHPLLLGEAGGQLAEDRRRPRCAAAGRGRAVRRRRRPGAGAGGPARRSSRGCVRERRWSIARLLAMR